MRADPDTPFGEHASVARAPELPLSRLAFFLDVDGTLLELAETPDAVRVEPETRELLRELSLRSGGAVALVSGRSISVLDSLFEPLLLPAAGLHGFERRNAAGSYYRQALPPGPALERTRRLLSQIVTRHAGLLLEDKRFALALHYRQAPELEDQVVRDVEAIASTAGSALHVQRGRKVIELRPASAGKETAVASFMAEPPFAGRHPICLGDDLTDEKAFDWVNAAGGVSIAVNVRGRRSAAASHLPSVTAARNWLRTLLHREDARA